MPAQPFDPDAWLKATEPQPFDPEKWLAETEPQNYLADKGRRLGRAIPKAIGDTVASAGSAVQSGAELAAEALRWRAVRSGDMTEAEAAKAKQEFLERAGQTAPMQAAQAVRDVGQEITDVGTRRVAAPDPARDGELGSAVVSGAASLAPLLAAGAINPALAIAAGGGYMGETQRQDAAEKGATPTQQAAAFMTGAPVGAASEALLGVPQMLKSVAGAKLLPALLGKAEGGLDGMMAGLFTKMAPAILPVAQQAVKSAVREGVQEGMEQIAQNTLAKDVVGYDPKRDRTEGAGMAMLAGSIVGGGVGAAAQAGEELAKPAAQRALEAAQRRTGPAQAGEELTKPAAQRDLEAAQRQAVPASQPPAATQNPSPASSTPKPEPGPQAAATAPNFVEDMLAKDAAASAAAREAAAKEDAARTGRQTELAEKKARFDQRLAVARSTLADPAAPFAAVDGALNSITSYAEDNALGLTQTQREQALQTQAALQKRHAQLAPAAQAQADTAAETRRTEAKLAEDAKAERVRRERAALQHLETTGRDLATGQIVDLTAVPDDELETLSSQPSALSSAGLTPQQIEAEQTRRGEAAERAAATSNEAGYTLRDLILGKKSALAAAGLTGPLRLKSPAALSLEGGTMAGEHRAIGERQGGFRIFSDTGLAEDTLQERLQSLGFAAPDVTAAYALYEQALAGEEIRPERGEEQQVDFARPSPRGSGSAAELNLRPATPYEITRQDSADLAAFSREVGPLTLQTFAEPDDLSEHSGRRPAGSPPAAEPTGARNLLQLIGQAFGKRVLLVQPRAEAKWSAATKPDRANTILINTRKGEPLLALIGHEFGHNLRAQRPELYRAFSRLVLDSNPVPPAYRAQKIAQLYPANRINDEWVNDIIAGRFDEPAFYRDLAAAESRRAQQSDHASNGALLQFIRAAQEWLVALGRRLRATLEPRAAAAALAQIERLRTRLAEITAEYQRTKPAAGYAENPAFARGSADADLTNRKTTDRASYQDTMDLGSTPLGLTLPNEIRNLAPRWQDKTLAFDSSLDKALYYAGGTPGELRTRIIDSIAEQTQLSPGEIATLARDLRQKLAPLARPAAANGTVRVPAQMQSAVRQITAVNFAMGEAEFAKAFDEAAEAFYQSARDSVGTDPERISAEDTAKRSGEILTPAQAAARLDEWKALAAKEGETGLHQGKTILSLFDSTGVWSRPWREAGFTVVQVDQQIVDGDGYEMDVMKINPQWLGDNGLDMVHGVLAACPCTEFAGSGARWFKIKDADGRTKKAAKLVNHTLAIIEYLQPDGFWAIENPVGRLKQETEIPLERLQFQPHNYGDPYTKRTQIYGSFNGRLPQANVEPTGGSYSWNLSGTGKNSKAERSKTFEGFAYAFFAANYQRDALVEIEEKIRRDDADDDAYRARAGQPAPQGQQAPIDFATQASDYVAANGTPDAKAPAARADIERILGVAHDEQLDLLPDDTGSGLLRPELGPAGSAHAAGADLSRAAEALKAPNQSAVVRAAYGIDPRDPEFKGGERISSIIPALVADPKRTWDIRGAKIATPRDLLTLVNVMRSPYVETAKIVLLNRAGVVVHSEIVGVGSVSAAIMDASQLAALLNRAPPSEEGYDIIFSHNHPGGNPTPSEPDDDATRALSAAVNGTKHNLRDHVITNGDTYFSYAESNWKGKKAGIVNSQTPDERSPVTAQPPLARGPDAETRVEPGTAAPWENVKRNDLFAATTYTITRELAASLRQVDPTALHLIYLNRQNRVTALERLPRFQLDPVITKSSWRPLTTKLLEGLGREGAKAFIIVAPDSMSPMHASRLMRVMADYAKQTGFTLIDYASEQLTPGTTARTAGLMEPTPSIDFAQGSGPREFSLSPELAARRVPVVQTPKLPGTTAKELRTAARAQAAQWLGQPLRNADTDQDIIVTARSLNHAFAHHGLEHIRAVPVLPELIRSAIHISSESHVTADPRVKAVHRYAAALNDAGRLLRVKLTVFEQKDGRLLYDHEATKVETPDGNILPASSVKPNGTGPASGATISLSELFGGVKPGERVQFATATGPDADPKASLADVEQRLAALSESQEDPAELALRGRALEAERDQLQRDIAAERRTAQVAASLVDVRHPLSVVQPEPGDAWGLTPKMTDGELARERADITNHLHDNYAGLAPAMRAHLNARLNALAAEQLTRGTPLGTVTPIPKIDRQAALRSELARGRQLRDEGDKTGNAAAQAEGVRLVKAATARLDEEFPGWDAKTQDPKPKTQPDPAEPPLPPEPPTAEAAPASEGDGEQSPFSGAEEETMPVRPKVTATAYGHSATQPTALAKSWEKARAILQSFRGAIPELPTFPAAWWNQADNFIKKHGVGFYSHVREYVSHLRAGNDYVQRHATEQLGEIIAPLLKAGGTFPAEKYATLLKFQETARRTLAEGKPLPPSLTAGITALNSQMESSPYVLFNRLVLLLDYHWRASNLHDDAGHPSSLPLGMNLAEVKAELKRLGTTLAASPHAALIETAIKQHVTLVAQLAADLKQRDLVHTPEQSNPYYFPHLTLEVKRGAKIEQRELKIEQIGHGLTPEFRGYTIAPVGSVIPIETDYRNAMYAHLVAVGAHNWKADGIRDYLRPYNAMPQIEARAAELSRQRGYRVSWQTVYKEEYQEIDYVKMGVNDANPYGAITIDRDKLARRLGVMLSGADLHAQLKELGLKGVKLLPEDLHETMIDGQKEVWILPARVAEAMRAIDQRADRPEHAVSQALQQLNSWWKQWKLFMPQSHMRYEYGNMMTDFGKLLATNPATFRHLSPAAKELRLYWLGGIPSPELASAVKRGVLDTLTAKEVGKLAGLPQFREFETKSQKFWAEFRAIGSAPLANATRLLGGDGLLGRVTSTEESAFREAVFRFANYRASLEALRNGSRPEYGGAYWKNIEATTESSPGAGDAAQQKAAAISKATFGDYGDISIGGQFLRDKFMSFYSWTEVNFKYNANVFRNLRDMVRAKELSQAEALKAGGRAAAVFAASFTARAAGGVMLRLALPYLAIALWNSSDDRDEIEKELSEEDRRRFHFILGRNAQGKPQVIYSPTALGDVMKWFSGQKFTAQFMRWQQGKTDFTTAFSAWIGDLGPDFLNNTAGAAGPLIRIPYTLAAKKTTHPDITDQRTIPAYDMRRNIIGQITDEFTADLIERIVNKDYYGSKDLGAWAKQLIFQVRQRDPESYAFYAIKDKANDFEERMTGSSDDSARNSKDQQVLRNFRRAIYRGDADKAVQFYQRLLDYGYTAERFQASIRSQDPLSTLEKKNGLREQFVASLGPDDRALLDRAYVYYQRINASRGRERQLFPTKASGYAGQMRYQAQPRTAALRAQMERVDGMTDEEREQQAQRDERRSLQKTR